MLRSVRHRRCLSVLLGLAAATSSMAALPAAASADGSGTITISSASSPAGNPGLLSVQAQATTPISSMTAHILSGQTDELDVTDFQLSSGRLTDGTWTVQSPIAGLALGTYQVTVDATDAGGDSVTGVGAGDLAFGYQTTITAAYSPAVVSYASPDVAFSGRLTGVAPGSTTPVDLPGVPVLLVNQDTDVQQSLGSTAADGSYRGTLPVAVGDYDVQVAASDTMEAAQSSQIGIGYSLTPTKVSATVVPRDVKYGQQATVTGTASYQDGSSWKPLPGVTVEVDVAATRVAVPQTDSAGRFSASLPSPDGNRWSVTVGAVGNLLLAESSAHGTMDVAVPMAVTRFSARLLPSGYLDAAGCLKVTVPNFTAPQQSHIQIQYAPRPGGPWKYLGRLPLGNSSTVSSSCDGNALAYFQGKIAARLANAYYRASYPGDVDFDHTVSKAAHAWLDTTRITSFKVTPPSVRAGQIVTLSGRLWRHARSWSGYGHRQISLLYRRKGAKTWYLISEVRTSASGSFSGTATASGRGTLIVIAFYGGDKTHLWSQSSAVTVSITAIQGASLGPAAQPRSRPGRLAGAPGRLPSAYLTASLGQA
jgi:hypothetical protein